MKLARLAAWLALPVLLMGCSTINALTLEDVQQARAIASAAHHQAGVECYSALEAPLAVGPPKGVFSSAEIGLLISQAMQGPCQPLVGSLMLPLLQASGGISGIAGVFPNPGISAAIGGALPALLPILMGL